MLKNSSALLLFIGASAVALTACSSAPPVVYSGISSAQQLKQNRDDDAAKVPYRYSTPVVWSKYTQVMIDPAVVYRGSDNQFGDMPDEDKAALADYMGKTFASRLAKRFEIASQPSAATLRVKLTLTGAEKTTPLVGQIMHFDIAGNLYNGVQAVRGGKGAFSGSVTYTVEVYDSSSNRLLRAYVSKQYPNAMNLPAAFGSLSAARTGLDKGADALVAQLQ